MTADRLVVQQEAAMSRHWLHATINVPPVNEVYLNVDRERANQVVTRYLVTTVASRALPFGIDHFNSLAEAKTRCHDDFGLQDCDWQAMATAPEFHAYIDQAIDQVLNNLTRGTESDIDEE